MSAIWSEITAETHAQSLPWWPATALPQAVALLAAKVAGSTAGPQDDLDPPPAAGAHLRSAEMARWRDQAGQHLDLVIDEVQCPRADLTVTLRSIAPALIWSPLGDRFLMAVRPGVLRGPEGGQHHPSASAVAEALLPQVHPSLARQIDRVARLTGVRQPDRLARAVQARVDADAPVAGLWVLRPMRNPALWPATRQAHLLPLALAVLACALALECAGIGLWAIAGTGKLAASGPLAASGWRSAFVLCLISAVPLTLLSNRAAAAFGRNLARLVRLRIMEGVLALPSGVLKASGAADMMARGLEAQAFEAAVTGLALAAFSTLATTFWAIAVLTQSAAPFRLLTLFAAVALGQTLLWRRYSRRMSDWTNRRRHLAATMIERMAGHRTTLAQEEPGTGFARQDGLTAAYARSAARMDIASLHFMALPPLLWMMAGFCVVALAPTLPAIATLGGIILAGRALGLLATVLANLSASGIAMSQISGLWQRAHRTKPVLPRATPKATLNAGLLQACDPVALRLHGLTIAYPGRQPVLQSADLTVAQGERVLLEGPSGAGKSSLVRVLAGLDAPSAGTVSARAGASHPVALSPQFHENHIFAGSFAFNLLMARAWPASAADLTRARLVAEALGLGPLIARMPGGLATQLGDTGWQLSHGEKSRLHLARALLQRAEITVLDESFAALDPETLQICLDAAQRLSSTLIVVGHP